MDPAPSSSVLQPELTDQQMALRLIERMDRKVSLKTMAERLLQLYHAKELATYFVEHNLLNLEELAGWIEDYAEHWSASPASNNQ